MKSTIMKLLAGAGLLSVTALGAIPAGATQVGTLSYTTSVNTDSTWTATQSSQTPYQSAALVECPVTGQSPWVWTTALSPGASWIWANVGQGGCSSNGTGPGSVNPSATVTLTKSFYIPGVPQSASISFAADNGAQVFINGNSSYVAQIPLSGSDVSNYASVTMVGGFYQDLHLGWNTITIVAENASGSGYNPAGVVASLTVSSAATVTNLCKNGAWATNPAGPNGYAGFLNQGDCMSFYLANPSATDPA